MNHESRQFEMQMVIQCNIDCYSGLLSSIAPIDVLELLNFYEGHCIDDDERLVATDLQAPHRYELAKYSLSG